ncbi:S-adenosyl-L-methionine-dependent methyltransferase [Mycena sanguinolenta]|uniref:S-adenosyl-L-methionine-dependent methyltransferase n=1 Tax=Mycena sanguinolenta TaxID=230812 RepID=A0A8H6ZFK7_9AGAR|nr:S-adenosyl-L-methionine-dependent methyltransferase [Mycena sanguinolenta]
MSTSYEQPMDDRGVYLGFPATSDTERLDTVHTTIARYFGNELGPAPLNGLRPSKVLELGCGTGTWAIQAAKQFPGAQVVAVDQFPLPDRNLPPNMTFHQADLQKLEFEDGTFDIVHARLVMVHVADGPGTLLRTSRLVKPGGLLLIEDLDAISVTKAGGPATRRFVHKYQEIQDGRGVDIELARKIEAIITSFPDFSDIQVKKISIPFAANTSDEALNQLGLVMKRAHTQIYGAIQHHLHDQGLTRELLHELEEEQQRDDNECVLDMYCCWARRSVE